MSKDVNAQLVFYFALLSQFRAYITPFIFAVGFLGNIFTIIVFVHVRPVTRFSIYAIALAICHLFILFFNTLLDDFMGRGLGVIIGDAVTFKLDKQSQLMCKLSEFMPNVMYVISSFMMVVFAVDRLLTLYNPLKLSVILHKKAAVIVSMTVYLLSTIFVSPLLKAQQLEPNVGHNGTMSCQISNTDEMLRHYITYFKGLITFTLPVILVIIVNILILHKLSRIKADRKIMLVSQRLSKVASDNEMFRIAAHLGITTAFLLLYVPLAASVLYRLHVVDIGLMEDTVTGERAILLSKLMSSVKDVTYAVNFFVYLKFLRNFRLCFLRLICSSCLYCCGDKMVQQMPSLKSPSSSQQSRFTTSAVNAPSSVQMKDLSNKR